jgi:hypothetical protein
MVDCEIILEAQIKPDRVIAVVILKPVLSRDVCPPMAI